ncbi:MAG: GDP-L-fucose synthase [Methanoregulaceae archaeon]|nr:GDP-L-fucose synthase [Methanoregulaceae archaeon]
MDKSSKIFIAGHRGLAGSAILRRLQSEDFDGLLTRTHQELDLGSQKDVEDFFAHERPNYVFLAAARVGGILANNTYPADFIYENLMIQTNVIHAAYKHGVNKLLFLGSSCIYPKLAPQPLEESSLLTGELEATNEPYAVAKIAGIKMCQSYNRQFGTNFISVMPSNLYGPNDQFDLEKSHVLSAMIRKFHLAKLLREREYKALKRDIEKYPLGFNTLPQGVSETSDSAIAAALKSIGITSESVVLWGSGSARREFLYVDDLADACIFLMHCYDGSEIVNIGTGQDLTIKELAEIVREAVGFDGKITWDLSKPDGTPRKLLNVSRLRKLGWEPRINLVEGIEKTYSWYKQSTELSNNPVTHCHSRGKGI